MTGRSPFTTNFKNLPHAKTAMARLSSECPEDVAYIGDLCHLSHPLTGLFSSQKAPGSVVLRTFDAMAAFRDQGRVVVGGFQSPMEKEYLAILLRGTQPIVVVLARTIEKFRIPKECRPAFDQGRILFLSGLVQGPKRVDRESAWSRNLLVAALCSEAYVAHSTPGGMTEKVVARLIGWGIGISGPSSV